MNLPFKKGSEPEDSQSKMPENFTSIICIPGNWEDWSEFIISLVGATNGEYLAVGNILMNTSTKHYYEIEMCERDERMMKAFSVAGMVNRVSEKFLEEIGDHKNVIYISGDTGNLNDATHIAYAAQAILKTGGLGIKIETAGKAFEKDQWIDLLENFEESNLYQMFVLDSLIDEDGTVYSCGMQNLGYRDTIVSGEEFQDAVDLIKVFGYYQIIDKPLIKDGQTFSVDAEAPIFRITNEPNQPYLGDERFGNPNGMWRLTGIE